MVQLLKTRSYLAQCPHEALADTAALGLMCLLIFAGFTLPAFL